MIFMVIKDLNDEVVIGMDMMSTHQLYIRYSTDVLRNFHDITEPLVYPHHSQYAEVSKLEYGKSFRQARTSTHRKMRQIRSYMNKCRNGNKNPTLRRLIQLRRCRSILKLLKIFKKSYPLFITIQERVHKLTPTKLEGKTKSIAHTDTPSEPLSGYRQSMEKANTGETVEQDFLNNIEIEENSHKKHRTQKTNTVNRSWKIKLLKDLTIEKSCESTQQTTIPMIFRKHYLN